MSSLEIAQLTNKEHRNVVADILKMFLELDIEGANFSAPFKMLSGQSTTIYNLPKREALILVSGYSIKMRTLIIDRWQELEKQTVKLPTTFKDAILALGESLAREEQQQLLLQQANTKLDNLLQWVSIVKVCGYNKVKETSFNWRVLKAKSEELDLPVKRAESARFGYQNLYHVNCFKACYPKYEYDFQF